ncbi:MAG: PadR family transcriptional regulator [Gemmatimonadaceae bacterium]|nr:PadR family transcriptional regulator [Gemmatimonadaceae bacterium]
MPKPALTVVPGTLDLLILKAVSWQKEHGYGIGKRIEERTAGDLRIEDGALYQALHRLVRAGALSAEWGVSDNGRRARYYKLTSVGRSRLAAEVASWRRYAAAVSLMLETP